VNVDIYIFTVFVIFILIPLTGNSNTDTPSFHILYFKTLDGCTQVVLYLSCVQEVKVCGKLVPVSKNCTMKPYWGHGS
jgi:hypothetical protein